MKALFTLTFVLFFAVSTQGQQHKPETKVETITMKLVPVSSILEKKDPDVGQVARLYRRPYARVKKALTFTTREHRPKVA